MRRPVLFSLTLTAALTAVPALAADVSGRLWSFAQGKVPGFKEEVLVPGTVHRIWDAPPGLQAERLMFLYLPEVSTDHWMLGLFRPKLSKSEYLGTEQLSFVGQTADPTTNVYRVTGGLLRGSLVQEWTDRGGRMVVIYSSRMALEAPKLARFVRP
ncbi:hypothetical protein [Deinococcus knuensis]|uniref:Uncharacterized protein n=1 Tax=Deinococcus knuensis TaxID=1837380 RepID=A0ABQ2STZ0_9DEIO|nr:hypothetical protein [Deinococcus knuensis]GGS40221.1 hypothetical protein GCM10008961_34500 [Deinococcus knuensis]